MGSLNSQSALNSARSDRGHMLVFLSARWLDFSLVAGFPAIAFQKPSTLPQFHRFAIAFSRISNSDEALLAQDGFRSFANPTSLATTGAPPLIYLTSTLLHCVATAE